METIGKADDGNREAMEMLDGLSGRRAEEIGAGTLDRMAAEGSPWAMFLLGRIFDQRGECEDDSCVAMGLYQDAADRMNPYAMVALAKMFERGDCVVKSFHNAYIQYKHAASLGCPPAERWMAENGELGRC